MKIFLIAMLFLAAPCVADDVKSVLGKSTFAGVVSITAGNQMPYENSELSDCGLRYTAYANIEQVFVNNIGWVEGYPIEFRAAWMLELGGRYLVFLNETAAGTADAIRNERELRTERCMGGGLQLVPVLANTQTFAWGAVFQEWRKQSRMKTVMVVESTWITFLRCPISATSSGQPVKRMANHLIQLNWKFALLAVH